MLLFHRKLLFLVVGVSAAQGALAFAQPRPDFSGTWKQDNARSAAGAGSTLQYSNRIDQKDGAITVTTISRGGHRKDSNVTRTYTADGKPFMYKASDGDDLTTTVNWEGNALVFETIEKRPKETITIRETWVLSEDGKTLTKRRHSSGPQGQTDQTYVLEKQN